MKSCISVLIFCGGVNSSVKQILGCLKVLVGSCNIEWGVALGVSGVLENLQSQSLPILVYIVPITLLTGLEHICKNHLHVLPQLPWSLVGLLLQIKRGRHLSQVSQLKSSSLRSWWEIGSEVWLLTLCHTGPSAVTIGWLALLWAIWLIEIVDRRTYLKMLLIKQYCWRTARDSIRVSQKHLAFIRGKDIALQFLRELKILSWSTGYATSTEQTALVVLIQLLVLEHTLTLALV